MARRFQAALVSRCNRYLSTQAEGSPNTPPIVLYQYTICPFCHQAKAFLDYHRTPYETIEVNPLTKAEIRPFRERNNYKQVPIGEVKGSEESQALLGSDMIIGHVMSGKNTAKIDEDEWAKFARKELAVLLYPNLCRTLSSSFAAFGYVHQVSSFSWLDRISVQYIGSLVRSDRIHHL